ncbi:MAG TPA: helix-turn-helix domain-containing protein [Pseudonocardia sp.]|jgi:AcrR family transcriptional regulator|nr:helix-turn-helix domain-containing protein [Pseudonocardia sp.]
MSDAARAGRLSAVAEAKQALILDAALRVFSRDGLREASIRSIAKEAGYAPGAIYAYFPSKEHLYAAALRESLERLRAATESAARAASDDTGGAFDPGGAFVSGGLAFFDFYDANPRDLDMGFYLFAGGIAPRGLSDEEVNSELNAALLAALEPIRRAAEQLSDATEATRLTADVFAHASGLLLLRHTHRLKLFRLDARELMRRYLDEIIRARRP